MVADAFVEGVLDAVATPVFAVPRVCDQSCSMDVDALLVHAVVFGAGEVHAGHGLAHVLGSRVACCVGHVLLADDVVRVVEVQHPLPLVEVLTEKVHIYRPLIPNRRELRLHFQTDCIE